MVECTALEMRHRCKPIGGSNPSLSAITPATVFCSSAPEVGCTFRVAGSQGAAAPNDVGDANPTQSFIEKRTTK